MSSKCERSEKTASGEEKVDDWYEDDLEDLELVKSGGEPGGGAKVVISSLRGRVGRRRSGSGCSVNAQRRETFFSVSGAPGRQKGSE